MYTGYILNEIPLTLDIPILAYNKNFKSFLFQRVDDISSLYLIREVPSCSFSYQGILSYEIITSEDNWDRKWCRDTEKNIIQMIIQTNINKYPAYLTTKVSQLLLIYSIVGDESNILKEIFCYSPSHSRPSGMYIRGVFVGVFTVLPNTCRSLLPHVYISVFLLKIESVKPSL